LTGISALAEIGASAFRKFYGDVELRGSCPNLRIIAENAFEALEHDYHNNPDGGLPYGTFHVELRDLSSLIEIGDKAFKDMLDGDLIIEGKCPSLQRIGEFAFLNINGAAAYSGPLLSSVTLSELQSLVAIEHRAFNQFGGELSLTGRCPKLTEIGFQAYHTAKNPSNDINIQ